MDEVELPLGLDPGPEPQEPVRAPLRYLAITVTARPDGTHAARVLVQGHNGQSPRTTLLYTSDSPLPDVAAMVQALHTAAEELRLRHREERGIL